LPETIFEEKAMFTMQDLPTMKERILDEIKMAAQNADIGAITQWSKAAEQCEILIRENTELESRVRDFVDRLWANPENVKTSPKEHVEGERPSTKRSISPKREGAMARDRWVKMLSTKHIPLTGHDKRYHTERGVSVGIAFANELDRPQLVNKWFLGFKDESTGVAVLLCQDKEGNLHDFIIPVAELGSSWEALSRSGGQVKFNIHRRKSEFLLSIPGGEPMSITKYIGNYRPLS
jgi:hypothetical protein